MAYDQIKESIKAVIKENGNYEITGNVLQAVLLSMVDTLGPEYQFLGIATKSTVPVVVEGNSFYITTEVGTYTKFKNSGNTTITVNQLGILTSTNGTAWNFTPIFIGVSKGGGEVFNDYDNNTAVGNNSHAEGAKTNAKGDNSHAEGNGGTATGTNSHVEGFETNAEGANSHAEGKQSGAFGDNSHAEGQFNNARGVNSHAEGQKTESVGDNSHAEGFQTHANNNNSHAEGRITVADGNASHAEGGETQASGDYSHAEGNSTVASGFGSHAEGQETTAEAANAHAEGQGTVTKEVGGHVAGMYNAVVANGLFNFGIGSSNDKRKSAMIIDGTNGKVYFVDAGGYDGGTSITNAKSIQDILKDSGGVEIEQLDESFDFNKNAQFNVFNNIEDGLHIYVGTYRAQNTQIARMLRITQYTEAGETKVQYFEYQEEVGATSCSFINASVIRTESEGSWSWAQRAYELRMYMQAIPTNNGALSNSDKVILDRIIALVLYGEAITSFFYFNNSSELVPMTLARTDLQQQQVLEFTGIATGRKVISLKATRTNVGGSIKYSNWSVTTVFLDQMNEIATQADNLAKNIYVLNKLLTQSDEFGTKTISITSQIESMIGGSYIDVIQGPIRDNRKIFVSVLSNNDRKDLIVWNLKTVGNFQGGNNDNGELVFSTMYTNPEDYSVLRRYIKLVITNSKFTVMTITTDAPIQNIYKPLLKVNIDSFKAKSGSTMNMDEINAAGITIQDVLDFRDGKKNMIRDISNLYFTLPLVGMMYVNNTEWGLCFESRISSNFDSNSILTGEMLCIEYSSNDQYNIHYAEI
nr:MAG: hypothetical protein [Bacteriophage sp.]